MAEELVADPLMGPLGRYLYAPTDVGPLWYSRLVAAPKVFNLLRAVGGINCLSLDPGRPAPYFVKVRFDGPPHHGSNRDRVRSPLTGHRGSRCQTDPRVRLTT